VLTQRPPPLQMPGFKSHSLMSVHVLPSTGVADGADELDCVAHLAWPQARPNMQHTDFNVKRGGLFSQQAIFLHSVISNKIASIFGKKQIVDRKLYQCKVFPSDDNLYPESQNHLNNPFMLMHLLLSHIPVCPHSSMLTHRLMIKIKTY
jgi:hypothetical protein